MKRLLWPVVLILCISGSAAASPRIRISAWYWLNSAPKADWQGDFVTMRNLGFTGVVIGWGIDAAAFRYKNRMADTRDAMRWAQQAGLRAYVIAWHPWANSLPRRPRFQAEDSAGHLLNTFDVFNPEWRNTQWKQYLQMLARGVHDEPAMAGYVFDDSFGIGGGGVISYGKYEQRAFGSPLPRKPSDPRWNDWVNARAGWWEDWARDTVKFIREVDPNPQHQIYLEDSAGDVFSPKLRDSVGVDFPRVAKHFDAFGAYTGNSWNASPDSGEKAARRTAEVLMRVRKVVNPRKLTIYTFWVANAAGELKPGPAKYPTAEQIKLICEAALQSGIKHLDMYGYRIGDYRVTPATLPKLTPGSGPAYPLTGQFPGKFLWDRPEIHEALAAYLRSLNGT